MLVEKNGGITIIWFQDLGAKGAGRNAGMERTWKLLLHWGLCTATGCIESTPHPTTVEPKLAPFELDYSLHRPCWRAACSLGNGGLQGSGYRVGCRVEA